MVNDGHAHLRFLTIAEGNKPSYAGWSPAVAGLAEMASTMYTVYVLRSKKSGRYYIGQTDDLAKRILRHNSGLVRSTKRDAPFDLIAKKEVASRSEAMQFEKLLKKQKGGQGFTTLLRGMEQ